MTQYLIFPLLALFLLASPAQAQETSEKGAKKLEKIFSDLVAKQQKKLSERGSTLATNGVVTVEQAADFYAVTLPAMTITDEQENRTDIGMIALNIKPTDQKYVWNMSVALPMPIIRQDKDGTKIAELNIAQQKMNGLWHEKIENFSTLNADYQNITFTDHKKSKTMALNHFVIDGDLNIQNDKMSGPTEIILSGITIGQPSDTDFASIENIALFAEYDDIDISAITPQNLIPMAKDMGGLRFKATAKNVKGAAELKELSFNYRAPKPNDNKADQFLTMDYHGLKEAKDNITLSGLIPAQASMDIALKNLPVDTILGIFQTQLEKEEKPSAAKQLILMQMITNLPKKLAEAGTIFDIKKFNFKNDTYDLKTEGQLKAFADSPVGMIGSLLMKMDGLDETQALIDKKITNADTANKAILERIQSQLTALKNIMHKTIGGYESDIKLTEDGTVTINGEEKGNPISAIGGL